MGTYITIKGADFSEVAVSKLTQLSLGEKMLKLSRDNISFGNDKFYPSGNRILLDLGLLQELLKGFSQIRISVNSPWKLARQYWRGLASSIEDYEKTTQGGLVELISNSTQWSNSINEPIPANAIGFSVLLNSDDVSAGQKNKYLSGFTIELIP